MLPDAVLHLIQVYNVSILLFIASPYLIYFLKSKSFDVKIESKYKLVFISFSLFFAFLLLFIDLIGYENSLLNIYLIRQSSEFFWLTSFIILTYLYLMSYFWKMIYFKSIFIESKYSNKLMNELISKTNKKMNLQSYHDSIRTNSMGFIPGSFFTKFETNIYSNEEKGSGYELFLFNSNRNFRILTILSLLAIFPIIMVRSQIYGVSESITETEILLFYIQNYQIDTVFWFIGGILLLIFFGITLSSIQENLIIEYENNFKNTKLREAIELPKLSIKRPDLKLNTSEKFDEFKDKLIQKKENTLKLLESKKNEEIKRIIGDKVEITKESKINPETIRLDALIRAIKNILSSTPIHREVSLEEILSLVNIKAKTNVDEIESIIIGLLNKGDVKGEYDIWKKLYKGGTSVQRYMSKYLDKDESKSNNIEAFKIKNDGTIEIHFNTGGEKNIVEENPNNLRKSIEREDSK